MMMFLSKMDKNNFLIQFVLSTILLLFFLSPDKIFIKIILDCIRKNGELLQK